MEDEPILAEDVKAESTNDEAIVADEPAPPEPSTEENKAEAKTSDEEPTEGKETEGKDKEAEGDEPEEEKSETEETQDDQPKDRAEVRQEKLNSEIREMVAKRNELRSEIAQLNTQVYQPQSAQEILDADENGELTPEMARIEAMEQRTALAEYNAHVSDLNASLNTEALQVLHDFQVFDDQSSEYNPEIAALATNVYQSVAGVQVDPKTGLAYQANATPYPVYEAIAKAYQAGAQTGKVSGQKASDKMLAAAETMSSASPKPAKNDKAIDAFDAEFDKL